jgi:NADH dehydrogenase (ubiquinone) 1 beta subcomplex subunit 7
MRRRSWTLTHCTEATREEMSAARLPLAYRDSCAHLLIPLNRCRHEEYYLPWKCEVRHARLHHVEYLGTNTVQNERHTYEKCQYEEFKVRVAKMDELRAAKNGQRSN